MISIEFTYKDYVYSKPRDELEEFRKLYNEFMGVAPCLGRIVVGVIIEKWEEIKNNWIHRLQSKEDYLELGKQIWRWVSEKLSVQEPEWCKSQITIQEERPEEREEEILFEILHDVVRDAIARYKHYVVSTTLYDKLRELYNAGVLPGWIHVRTKDLVITSTVIKEMEKRYDYTPLGGVKGLAERLGLTTLPLRSVERPLRG